VMKTKVKVVGRVQSVTANTSVANTTAQRIVTPATAPPQAAHPERAVARATR